MDVFAPISTDLKNLEALAKIFMFPAKIKQLIQQNELKKSPDCLTALAVNLSSAFFGSFTHIPTGTSNPVSSNLEY